MPEKRLAILNPDEERAWENYFNHAVLVGRKGGDAAADRTWRKLQKEFPRLKDFDGCKP